MYLLIASRMVWNLRLRFPRHRASDATVARKMAQEQAYSFERYHPEGTYWNEDGKRRRMSIGTGAGVAYKQLSSKAKRAGCDRSRFIVSNLMENDSCFRIRSAVAEADVSYPPCATTSSYAGRVRNSTNFGSRTSDRIISAARR